MFDALKTLDDGSQLTHPILRRIYAYWSECCSGRWAPARPDIDPADLGPLLPYIALIQPLPQSQDYRLRLLGGHILEGYHLWPTPRFLSEIDGGSVTELMRTQYDRVIRERRPLRYGPKFSAMPGREHIVTEHIDLPLSGDNLQVDMIMAAVVLLSEKDWKEQTGIAPSG